MLENGGAIGLLIGVVVCIIIVLIAKKESANLDEILKTISEEHINLIKNQTYTKTAGKDLFISKAFVASTEDLGDKVKAVIVFYAQERQEFFNRTVKLSKEEAKKLGVEAGNFVPSLMKYNKDMHYYDYKKLYEG